MTATTMTPKEAGLAVALEECYRVACHLEDKRTTPKRAIAQIKTIVRIALAKAAVES